MARGDHIYFEDYFAIIPYTHHGIDCGDGTVIHYATDKGVCRVSIYEFSKGKETKKFPYASCDTPDIVIRRAESRIGELHYHLIFNNCELFANWCKTGLGKSKQVKIMLDLLDFLNWRMDKAERQSYEYRLKSEKEITTSQEKRIQELIRKLEETEKHYQILLNKSNESLKLNSTPLPEPSLLTDKFDYHTLELLLQEGYWQEADEFTFYAMLKVSNREYERYFRPKDIANFPREDLLIIDNLWRKYSQNLFGFSIQKKIYTSLGGNQNYQYDIWERFSEYVGWRVNDVPLLYEQLNFSMKAPKGHFPNGKRIGSEIIGFLAVI